MASCRPRVSSPRAQRWRPSRAASAGEGTARFAKRHADVWGHVSRATSPEKQTRTKGVATAQRCPCVPVSSPPMRESEGGRKGRGRRDSLWSRPRRRPRTAPHSARRGREGRETRVVVRLREPCGQLSTDGQCTVKSAPSSVSPVSRGSTPPPRVDAAARPASCVLSVLLLRPPQCTLSFGERARIVLVVPAAFRRACRADCARRCPGVAAALVCLRRVSPYRALDCPIRKR